MRAATVLSNLRARGRRRSTWIAFLVGGAVSHLLYHYLVDADDTSWADYLHPFLLSLAYVFASPAGWQWSGDDRTIPRFGRALAQSALWCGLLLGLEFGLYLLLGRVGPDDRWDWVQRNAAFHAPFLVMVGFFIARGERVAEFRNQAQAQAREARWNLLQSQISPHFLFNALGAFAELGRRDWPATEQGLLALSDVYRRLLALSRCSETTLGDECVLLEKFLAIESLRLGGRVRIAWDWDEDLDLMPVPPFLLLPLVENAVKHGLEACPDGELVIAGRLEGGEAVLEVSNTGAWGLSHARSGGVGLNNLKARLRMRYHGGARLCLSREGEWTRARIHLPAQAPRRAAVPSGEWETVRPGAAERD